MYILATLYYSKVTVDILATLFYSKVTMHIAVFSKYCVLMGQCALRYEKTDNLREAFEFSSLSTFP